VERKTFGPGQDPRCPVNGYVADRSLTGTKTTPPDGKRRRRFPVVSREQIRDQNPGSLRAKRCGTRRASRSETFGADTRNDWFKIRRFRRAGRRPVSGRNAAPELRVRDLGNSRHSESSVSDILRGPSAVLYGGTGPGGLVISSARSRPTSR